MTKEELIGRISAALFGLGDFFESLKAQHPDLAPLVDPKIAELRSKADAGLLGGVVGIATEELKKMADTRSLDPRFKPGDLAG